MYIIVNQINDVIAYGESPAGTTVSPAWREGFNDVIRCNERQTQLALKTRVLGREKGEFLGLECALLQVMPKV